MSRRGFTPTCHYCGGVRRENGVRLCWHVPHPDCGWTNPRSRRRVPVCINHAFGLRLQCTDDDV